MMGFDGPIRAIIIGARGGIGAAFVRAIHEGHPNNRVWATTRSGTGAPGEADRSLALDITDESSIEELVRAASTAEYEPNLVLNCTGLLHTADFGPERSWRHLNLDTMRTVFEVNAFGVGLLGKHLIPILPRSGRTVFGSLSARVGSIGDNRLGGWHSYRASKAAQNMLIKGLAIEASMRWKGLICVALHPGTVATELSDPFSARVPPEKLFTPDQSCAYLCSTIASLTPAATGGFFAWDGQAIEY